MMAPLSETAPSFLLQPQAHGPYPDEKSLRISQQQCNASDTVPPESEPTRPQAAGFQKMYDC